MKAQVLISVLFASMPLTMMAQDDMYFTPSKQSKVQSKVEDLNTEEPTYYSGSDRDVDEYNRRGKLSSYYQKIGEDSLGNDVIVFHTGDGTYDTSKADTVYKGSGSYYGDDDFAYSRRMSRFDGFYGYYPWYDPWYAPWYDPWYYGYGYGWSWRYGWYSPYYYGYYGWGYPYYRYGWGYPYYYGWGYPRYYGYYGHAGTRNHGFNRHTTGSRGRHGYARNGGSRGYNNSHWQYGTHNSRSWNNNSTWSHGASHMPSRSSGSFGGGGFGGGSRGGGFGGGSRGGGGGGHFGRR